MKYARVYFDFGSGFSEADSVIVPMQNKGKHYLLGLKLNIYNNNPFKGKVILYNNLTQIEVKNAINDTKRGIKDAVLEVVTEEFINWKVNYLIKHLKNENEWYSKARKEIKNE